MHDELVLLHFGTVHEADAALGTVRQLASEGFIEISDAAVISRDADGWVHAEDAEADAAIGKTALGGMLGLVAGGLLTVPVIGAIAGAGIVARKYLGDDHLDDLMERVGRELTPGTAVLALTVSSIADPDTVTDRLDVHRDRLIRADIPPSVRARIDEG